MPQRTGNEKWLNWSCRILIVLGILLVVSGYLSWYQSKSQLISPLIPKETIDQILEDSQVFEASIAAAVFLLGGVLSYTFNKRIAALVLLGMAVIAHQVITRYLIF